MIKRIINWFWRRGIIKEYYGNMKKYSKIPIEKLKGLEVTLDTSEMEWQNTPWAFRFTNEQKLNLMELVDNALNEMEYDILEDKERFK